MRDLPKLAEDLALAASYDCNLIITPEEQAAIRRCTPLEWNALVGSAAYRVAAESGRFVAMHEVEVIVECARTPGCVE